MMPALFLDTLGRHGPCFTHLVIVLLICVPDGQLDVILRRTLKVVGSSDYFVTTVLQISFERSVILDPARHGFWKRASSCTSRILDEGYVTNIGILRTDTGLCYAVEGG